MIMTTPLKRPSEAAFTLIELLVVITILGLLITLAVPNISRVLEKANEVKCAANLRGISAATQNYAVDNNNHYPEIESMPTNPVYSGGVGSLLAVLGPYGVTDASLRCPDDIAGLNYYKKEGSSYQWRPTVDDELVSAPKFYSPRRGGTPIVLSASRIPLASDYTKIHHFNVVFADGHIRRF